MSTASEGTGRPSGQDNPENDSDETPALAPIPDEGTAAPSDSGRVFGQSTGSGTATGTSTGTGTGTGTSAGNGPGTGDGPTPSGIPAEPPRPGAQPTPAPADDKQPPPLSEEEQQRLRSRGRLALIFSLAGALIAVLFFPTGLIPGLLLAIVGAVLGILTWRAGRRREVRVPGTAPAIVIGGLAFTLMLCMVVVAVIYWQEISAAVNCTSGANTQTAREDCVEEFTHRMERRGVKVPDSP